MCRLIHTSDPLKVGQDPEASRTVKGRTVCTRSLLGLGLALLLLSGCTSLGQEPSDGEDAWIDYSDQVGIRDWNTTIELSAGDPQEGLASGGVINLLLTNESNQEVWFAPGYGAVLLTFSEDSQRWEDVDNLATYLGEGEVLEPRRPDGGNWVAVTSVAPGIDLQTLDGLRVAVVGQVVAEGGTVTDERVGAYLDIEGPR